MINENLNLPDHIAFIMDGNGRWAKARGLNRSEGHKVGAKTMDRIIQYCYDIGIKHITFYGLSTENLTARPKDEIAALLTIMTQYLNMMIQKYTSADKPMYRHTKINFIGDLKVFNSLQREKIKKIMEKSDELERNMTLNIAVNYGGKNDIVQAVNKFIKEKPNKKISENDIAERLYTAGQPDPDLVIRTGGEMRLSNFLIWQTAYSEYYSTSAFWPDFNDDELNKAIFEYNKRVRKFGGLK